MFPARAAEQVRIDAICQFYRSQRDIPTEVLLDQFPFELLRELPAGGRVPLRQCPLPFLLLDARRALYDAQLAQTGAMRDRLTATVVLLKALGRGWEA